MRLYNTLFKDEDDFCAFLKSKNIQNQKGILVQVFSGSTDKDVIGDVLKTVTLFLPDATLIGATTTGEIADGEIFEQSIIISIATFTSVEVNAVAVQGKELQDAYTPILQLIQEETKLLLLFTAGMQTNPVPLFTKLAEDGLPLCIGGGMAGDNNKTIETNVFLGNEILSEGIVAVTLTSPDLYVQNLMKFNCDPIGKVHRVTAARGNIIETIDDIPVVELYRHYFGNDVVENLPSTASLFPFTQEKFGILTSKMLVAILDNGEAMFTGEFEVGDELRFAYANIDRLLSNSYLESAFDKHIEGMFVYSCGGRKLLLGREVIKELTPLQDISPTAGFFTYGEFYTPKPGHCEVLNVTMTMLALSERPEPKEQVFPQAPKPKEQRGGFEFTTSDIMRSLTHFTRAVTSELDASIAKLNQQAIELDKKNKELQRLSTTDKLTGLFNRRKLDEVLQRELAMAERYLKPLSIVIFDIDRFKRINDKYGHPVGDLVLQTVASVTASSIRKVDSLGRWGGEEFLLICPETNLENGTLVAEKIRQRLKEHDFPNVHQVTSSFGVAQWNAQEDKMGLLTRADSALYRAKENGRNRVEMALPPT